MSQAIRGLPRQRVACAAAFAVLGAAVLVAAVATNARGAVVATVTPAADSYVRSDQPGTNFGTKAVLGAQAASATTPATTSYVRFVVAGMDRAPAKVVLRLYSYAASPSGVQVWTAANDWTETGLTWAGAPPAGDTMVGAVPNLGANAWSSLDVGRVVTGNGTYTFAITSTSTPNKQLASRETGTPPALDITVDTPRSVVSTGGGGQAADVGTTFAAPLAATVTDGAGGGVPNEPVTFTAPATGASGTFAGGTTAVTVTTDTAGKATTPAFTAGPVPGGYTVAASTATAPGPATFALTNRAAATASAASATTTFPMAADSYVRSDQPDTNFGGKYGLLAQASPVTITSYVRVVAKNLADPVTSASLQLYSYSTYAPGIRVWTADNGWTEAAITYTNAPPVGTAVGTGPNLKLDTWVSVDVSGVVTGNGTYSFAVTTDRTASNQLSSREAAADRAPRLVVTTAPASGPSVPPSPSVQPTPSTTAGRSTTATGGATQSATVGTAFGAPLAVQVTDGGRPVAATPVTFTAPPSGASATFPGGAASVTVTTNADGRATTTVTAGATTGAYAVTATSPGSEAATFALTNTDPRIVAAGDIACTQGKTPTASTCQQLATSDLAIGLRPDAVLPLGDDQYELGSLSDFQAMYDPSWGRLNAISRPIPGNHEWGYIGTAVEPTGGTGYFTYFGDRSHPLAPGCTTNCTSWYSYEIGSWHVVALDSQCTVVGGCNPGNPQYKWLQADLAAHPAQCTLAYWHIPLFSSSQDHQPDMQAIYTLLSTKGADVVLNGHAHFYERFAPQDAAGAADPARGLAEFIVGSGGRNFFAVRATPAANSAARIANTFGVLEMTLSGGGYSWNFVGPSGSTARDSGAATCH
jgi:hypothetical protein